VGRLDFNSSWEVFTETLDWYAIHVRCRSEQATASHISGKGYELFLPTYREVRRWSDRKKVAVLPLFPGYLFCRLDLRTRLPILQTPGVIDVVSFGGKAAPVDPLEISVIQRMMTAKQNLRPHPYVRQGDRVRLTEGPLAGVEGFLVRQKPSHRLVVSVALLQRSVGVEVSESAVELVAPRSIRYSDEDAQLTAGAPSLLLRTAG
jgi:transcription antitermination factor NusG